jgi:hypothetical protein
VTFSYALKMGIYSDGSYWVSGVMDTYRGPRPVSSHTVLRHRCCTREELQERVSEIVDVLLDLAASDL